MRTSLAVLGLPLLALLLALSPPPASGRLLRESAAVPGVPFLLKALKGWLPALGTSVPLSSSSGEGDASSTPRNLIAEVDAPGAATRNESYEDAGIMSTIYPSSDCSPECTGDLVCLYRRKAHKKVCRCRRGSKRQSPDSDVCVSLDGSTTGTPKNEETTTTTTSGSDTSTATAPTATDITTTTTGPSGTDITTTTNPTGTGMGGGEPCNMQCDMNRRLLKLVNAFRAENGKPPLCLHNKLILAAKFHSDDTAANGIFSHTGSDGSLYYTQNGIEGRVERAGFVFGDCPEHQDCDSENFGMGLVNEEVAFNMWKNSPGHRANLLCNAQFVGAYATDNYYTQDFASNPDYECNN